jgi:Response regulator containing a CheY-like receiver domain and a GGDEF domain
MPSKVLLAGSDRMLQQMANTFDAGQIHTVSANDGYEALCLLNETTPDMLIAEIALAGKDGYALCHYIRHEPEFQTLPVILLDSQFDSSNRSLAYTVGADVYLSQPFQPDELIDVVHKLLESKEADDEKSPSIPVSATRWQPVILNVDDSAAPDIRQEAARPQSSQPAFDEQAVAFMPPPSRLGRPSHLLFWVVGIAALLIGISLAVLLQTPAPGLQTSQQASSLDNPAENGALAMAGQPYMTAPEKVGQANLHTEAASPPESSDTARQATPDAKASAIQSEASVIPTAPNDAPMPEARQDESNPTAAPATVRKDSPVAGERRPYTPTVRPRMVRSTTTTNHWRRGGEEMVEAGEHFGSGTKHFSKGGADAAVWAGKKAGSGVKRIGMALKRLF